MNNSSHRSTEIISVDIGTTNLKITLFSQDYQKKHSFSYNYSIYAKNGFDPSEVEVDFLWSLFLEGIEEISAYVESAACELVLTTAMHSVILCDEKLIPVSPIYTWLWSGEKDQSFNLEKFEQMSNLTPQQVYQLTGTPAHIMNPFFKLWHLKQSTDLSKLKIASIKDLFFYRLTQKWWLDSGNASATGLCSYKTHSWQLDLLGQLGIKTEQLPLIRPYDARNLYNGSRDKLKKLNITIILGSSDGISSNYVYQTGKDAAVLSLGTSHAVRLISSQAIIDQQSQNFCYYISPNRYLIGYSSNNGGNVIEWLSKEYQLSFADMEEIVASLSYQGPPVRLFMPFIFGERSPLWNHLPKAYFKGDTQNLSTAEKVYAILCGLCFNIRYNIELLQTRQAFSHLNVVGGLTSSKTFLKLLANIIGMDLQTSLLDQAETLGTIALIDGIQLSTNQQTIYHDPKSHQAFQVCYESFFTEIKLLNSLELSEDNV